MRGYRWLALAAVVPILVGCAAETNHPSQTSGESVIVEDLRVDQAALPAYLVRPDDAAPGSAPGIVFFHWVEYGSPTSNRTEFLEEAKELADAGVVSILVDGSFPWHSAPDSIAHDTAALDGDLQMLRKAYEALLAQPAVDPSRTMFVGHDFGSMYQSVVFAEDERPLALVMMAPTARWADWFAKYWRISDDPDAYAAALAPYDPVMALPRIADRPILLQFADNDQYVPAEVASEIAEAAGDNADVRHYDAGHDLEHEDARADRVSWVKKILGLGAQ
jgi:predicted esterase